MSSFPCLVRLVSWSGQVRDRVGERLVEAIEVVGRVEGIAHVFFTERDVVRHSLVQRIIRAYDDHKSRQETPQLPFSYANGGNGKSKEVAPLVPSAEPVAQEPESGDPVVE